MLLDNIKINANVYLFDSITTALSDIINGDDKVKIDSIIKRYTNINFFNKQLIISSTAFYRIIDYIKYKYNIQVDFQLLYNQILNTYDKDTYAFVNTNRGFVNLYILNHVTNQIQKELFDNMVNKSLNYQSNKKVLLVEDTSKINLTLYREQYFMSYIKNLYANCDKFIPTRSIEEVSKLYQNYFVEHDNQSFINDKLMFDQGKPTELFNQLVFFTDMLLTGKDYDLIININHICPLEIVNILQYINLDLQKVENIKLGAFKLYDQENEFISDNVSINDISNIEALKYELMKLLLSSRLSFDKNRESKSIQFIQTLYSKICGLFKYAEEHQIDTNEYFMKYNVLSGLEQNLLLMLVCYNDKLKYIRKSCVYSELFSYLQLICTMFKKSYSSSRYIDKENIEVTKTKLTLARFVQYVLKHILSIYGIQVSDEVLPHEKREYKPREQQDNRHFTRRDLRNNYYSTSSRKDYSGRYSRYNNYQNRRNQHYEQQEENIDNDNFTNDNLHNRTDQVYINR